ncbi:MAG: response regulator [Candidatus Gracilibacteria bacterium]
MQTIPHPKILLIDDDPVLIKALGAELIDEGFEFISALDGEVGLTLVKTNVPDMILLDLIMPQMGGFEVLKELKSAEHTKNIPVILLTNLGPDENVRKGMALGAVDYCVKSSVNLEKIVNKINTFLAK